MINKNANESLVITKPQMDRLQELLLIFPGKIREAIERCQISYDQLREIRVRAGQKIRVIKGDGETTVHSLEITEEDVYQIMERACEYSLYSYEDNIKQGFITLKGGHRIGLGGYVVLENNQIKTMGKITFLCIRVAHELVGCADSVMQFLTKNHQLKHTLIVSPPGYGKTTLLRDMVRQISDGGILPGKNVAVIDERSELAACYKGVPQNDLGTRTDVLDNCPKEQGMIMAVRSLSPQVIAVDEIGGLKDVDAVLYCMHCGCIVIGTIHGTDENDVLLRSGVSRLLDRGTFSRLIIITSRDLEKMRMVDLEMAQ